MSRSTHVTIATILQFLWSAAMVVLTLPDLAKGATPESGGSSGYAITVVAFAAGILGVVAAYGTWMNMRAGKILAIVINLVFEFLLLGAVLFASPRVKLIAGSILVIPIMIVILLLWRTPQPGQDQSVG